MHGMAARWVRFPKECMSLLNATYRKALCAGHEDGTLSLFDVESGDQLVCRSHGR